ncbi:MAG: cation:proton antiporter, partial [Alloprevotella sp.]
MDNLAPLISDLALILIVAGVVTLIFKRLKQPLVLGYIVAGFLAGPHMPYTPSVEDLTSIHLWSEIGVIFLMFTLGLEFSFKKIVKMGIGPVIAACTVMFCMIGVGRFLGTLFGWDSMNSLFLGGMLAMSSTTIIYKALDDLGLRQQKFAGEVLSVLILEDILGILLMVVLSALAVSRHFEGAELMGSLLKLGFFLILWFVVGVYVVPLFLRGTRKWMNRETLLVVSVGLCFLLVVIASKAGYSSAFGAFMMGSILAETVEAESIERVTAPVKDLFGAIFFVSVGMMVDPAVLAEYWLPILAICVAIIVGQAVFGTTGFLLSGQPLRVAVQCGFSLAQIGEFAFILAALGVSLHVTADFLYPVVVAVSIITTFLTPYMIRAATPAYEWLERALPKPVRRMAGHAPRGRRAKKTGDASDWKRLLIALTGITVAYATLCVAAVGISFASLLPASRGVLGHWPGNVVCGVLTILVASPFLRAIVMRKNHSEEWKSIARRGRLAQVGLWNTFAVRYLLAAAVVYYVLDFLSPFWWPFHVAASLLIVAGMVASRGVKWVSIKMERTFMQNLKIREVSARRAAVAGMPAYARRLEARNIHIAQLEIPANSRWGGCTLAELSVSHTDGVMVVAIRRGDYRINIPDGHTEIYPGDGIEAIGDDAGIAAFAARLQSEVYADMAEASGGARLAVRRLIIRDGSPFEGHTLSGSGIRSRHHCMVIGFEEEN